MSYLQTLQTISASAGVRVDLLLFALIFARLAGALSQLPFLGGRSVPARVKVGLAAVISVILYPSLTGSTNVVSESFVQYMALLAKEVLVGVLMGFIGQLVFFGVQMAGTIIDTQRGLNQITYLAPQLPGNVSALGGLQFQASIALFVAIGGHLIVLRAVARSFLTIPLLQVPHLSAGWMPLAELFARISATTILTGATLCAPVVLAVFLVDLSFGCIGKVAPSIQISADANVAKCWIGLAVFLISIALFLDRLQTFLLSIIPMIDKFAKAIA
jgi:flagellar biosynthesis protein FliR